MKSLLTSLVLSSLLFLTSCSTSYKPSPSTSKISERASNIGTYVTTAQANSDAGKSRVISAETKTKDSETRSSAVDISVLAARKALAEKNYIAADNELVKIKVDNETIRSQLSQTLVDLVEARKAFDKINISLVEANKEVTGLKVETTTLQNQINNLSNQAAKDREIAKRCNSWFGLGAIFYGVERLLKTGIIGILILAGVAIALIFVGGPAGAFVLTSVKSLWSKFRKPKQF